MVVNHHHHHHQHVPGVLVLHLPALPGRSSGRVLAVDGFPDSHGRPHTRISSCETSTIFNGFTLYDQIFEILNLSALFQLCRFGPCLMSRRQPFSLRPLVFLYNLSKPSSSSSPSPSSTSSSSSSSTTWSSSDIILRLCRSQLLHWRRDLSHLSPAELQLALPAGENIYEKIFSCFLVIILSTSSIIYNIIPKVDYSDDPRAVRIAAALWWYYASKLFELLGRK